MTGQQLAWRGLAVVAAGVIAYGGLWPSNDRSAPAIVISDEAANQQIAVQIHGAVATPGVYWLPGDARVQSVIDAAGGANPNADLSGLNLARRVDDEEQLEIPAVQDSSTVVAITTGSPATESPPGVPATVQSGAKININLATAAELDALPGIGPAIAGRIVSYRTQHGPFASLEELSNVSGISTRMVDELRDMITIGS